MKSLKRTIITEHEYQTVKIVLLLGLLFMNISAGCTIDETKTFIGNPGGHEGPLVSSGPPMDPDSWHKVPGDVLGGDGDYAWGARVNARTTFKVPGGMGLLYNSRIEQETRVTSQWIEGQIERGLVKAETGSIAYTRDLLTWNDYSGNPILNEAQRPWQTNFRVLVADMFYDYENNRWVAYFGDRNGDWIGIRAVGVTYSRDLVNWEYADGPILTIEDYVSAVPERVKATEEELDEYGRVYLGWSMYYNGRYYVTLSGTEEVGYVETGEDSGTFRATSSGRVVLVADSPEGPFEHTAEVHDVPSSKPVYWNGRWYYVFADTWNEQPGFGLAWSDDLFGPYISNPENPIITVETIQRSNPILFNYEGIWGVLFTRGNDWWKPLPLRMAIANYHPSLFMTE